MNNERPTDETVFKQPPIAQAITDMAMQEYAHWIVYGTIPPGLLHAVEKEKLKCDAPIQNTK